MTTASQTPSPHPLGSGYGDEVAVLSIQGWHGVLDVRVPTHATFAALAEAYAVRADLDRAPILAGRDGTPYPAASTVREVGLGTGAVIVALGEAPVSRPTPHSVGTTTPAVSPGGGWSAVAVSVAAVAGGCVAQLPSGVPRAVAVVLLVLAGLLSCIRVGPRAAERAAVAPAFVAIGVSAWWWNGDAEQWPALIAIAGLTAAVTAALGRLHSDRADDALQVWLVAGVAVFVVCALTVVVSAPPAVAWTVLLIGAVLSVRAAPSMIIRTPDRTLLDLELLAVTAWTAHDVETTAGTSGAAERAGVRASDLVEVVASAGRRLRAAAVGTSVIAAGAATLLLAATPVPIDRIGARCMVGAAGVVLLLAARSHRAAVARHILRIGAAVCLLALSVDLLAATSDDSEARALIAVGSVLAALTTMVGAVLTGRDRRSTRLSRYADSLELVCGAVVVGAAVVATGLFRLLWTMTG